MFPGGRLTGNNHACINSCTAHVCMNLYAIVLILITFTLHRNLKIFLNHTLKVFDISVFEYSELFRVHFGAVYGLLNESAAYIESRE